MPSTISTPVTARIPTESLPAFRHLAARYGLTPSKAIAQLVDAVAKAELAQCKGSAAK